MRVRASVLGIALLALAPHAGPASASPCPSEPGAKLTPCDLEVIGGEEAWHSEDVFSLRWRNPPEDGRASVVAVHYRGLDVSGQVFLHERRIPSPRQTIERIQVPPAPGIYAAEIRLENESGELGPWVRAHLRFDDTRPGPVQPLLSPGWIGGPDFPVRVRLERPPDPQPPAGIRGYAFSVDRNPEGDPCAAADRCSDIETDLAGGIAKDSLVLDNLPEGVSYLHAAAVSGSGMKSTTVSHGALRVDTSVPLTMLSGAASGWSNRPVAIVATATDTGSGMAPLAGGGMPFTALRIDGGAPIVASGDSVGATVVGSGVHTVASYARDAAGNVGDFGGPAGLTGADRATVRIDTEAPQLRFANSQNPRDPETVEAWIDDPLSGVDGSRGQIAVRAVGSGDRFVPLPTEFETGRLRARWESDGYPPGRYEFRASGYDRAGNAAATAHRGNGSGMVLSAPLKMPTSLTAQLGGRSARPLRPDHGAVLSGRLLAGRRAPVAAVPVRVIERFDPGSSEQERFTTVRTDSTGEFSVRLPPGPSRTVLVSFAGTRTLGRSLSQAVRLAVRGKVRMRASARRARVGGKPVVFEGRVAVPRRTIPPEGKYVELQFRLPGFAWSAFRTVRTDRQGRFRYAYRFSDDDSRGVRFEFRAYAPAQSRWPYEPAGSRPVAVRGG